MLITPNSFFRFRLLPFFLLLIFVVSCGSKDKLAGVYKAEGKG